MKRAIFIFVSLTILTPFLPFAAQAEVLRLKGTLLEEAELDRTLISKPGWLRGLHILGTPDRDVPRPHLRVVLPVAWAGDKLCARITTIAGDYSALVEYDIPQELAQNTDYILDFETQSETVQTVTPDNSGVSLERGACSQDPSLGPENRQFIANFWNEDSRPKLTEDGAMQIVLNMNIARADELSFAARAGDAPLASTCRKLTNPEALAYNFRCQFTVDAAQFASAKTQEIHVAYTRIYRARQSAPRTAVILIGASQ